MNILSNYRIRCNCSSLEIWKRKHTHLMKKSGRLLLLQTQEMINGVMKRHGYSGMPASHGAPLSHRSGGSTGQRDAPGKVFKGKKMPGRMGGEQRTVQNVWLYKIDPKRNLMWVKGQKI